MAKKREHSSDSSSSSSSEEEDESKKKSSKAIISSKIVSSDSDSSSDDDDDWNAKPKAKAKGKRGGRSAKKPAPAKLQKKKQKTSDSDVSDASESSEDEPKPSKSRISSSKGHHHHHHHEEKEEGEVEDMSNDEDEEEFNDGFDDNLMGDDEDRKRLAEMTEKEREQVLFNRCEQREVLKTRFEINRKLRLAKKKLVQGSAKKAAEKNEKADKTNNDSLGGFAADSSSRSVERRRNMEDKRKVKDAIKGLKAEREKKKMKQKLRAADVYSDSSDSDSASDARPSKKAPKKTSSSSDSSSSSSLSDDDSDTDVKGKSDKDSRRRGGDNDWDKGRSSDGDDSEQFTFSLEHLKAIRVSRFKMEKWCHAPFFKDTVTGCYARVGIGNVGPNPQYIVAQIVDVVETPKVYMLGKTRTNKGIKIKHAKNPERVYRLEFISNQEFTPLEWDKWYNRMLSDRCDFPSREFVERKKSDIQRALNYQFSDADVAEIVAEKEKFRKDMPVNFAMRKTQLMKEKEFAQQNDDNERANELDREINRLEEEAKRRDTIRTKNIAAISFINERNRMRNIKEAERVIAESAKEGISVKDDPFTRRKCAPQMISNFNKKGGDAAIPFPGELSKGNAAEQNGSNVYSSNSKGNPTTLAGSNGKLAGKSAHPETTPAGVVDPDDLFSAHNFDIKIDFDLPLGGNAPSSTTTTTSSFNGGFLSGFSNGKATNGYADARPNSLVSSSGNRRSLNLDEYKKRKGLI